MTKTISVLFLLIINFVNMLFVADWVDFFVYLV